MTWSISASGPREAAIDTLANAPIPTHLDRVNEQQHYSRVLDLVIATLRASTKAVCSVSASGWMDVDGRCSCTISSLATFDPQPDA